MKIRNGFVSNSSSSSFTLALPAGTKTEDIEGIMLKKMEVPKTSIIYDIAKELAHTFADGVEDQLDIDKEIAETKKYLKEYQDDWEKDWITQLEAFKKKGMTLFKGSFCDDGEAEELILCYSEIRIDRDDIYYDNSGRC